MMQTAITYCPPAEQENVLGQKLNQSLACCTGGVLVLQLPALGFSTWGGKTGMLLAACRGVSR